MHQIRRHLAIQGNPVLGDDKYGDFTLNKKLRKSSGLKNLLLHASRLIINDDIRIDISAPTPDYFSWYLQEP
jgi:23S rRNA pseudouridine955/2504/2580 synthase